jgi:UDP-2,4-diacetamido-2,4,6-trideoxy-beta-L-altropyranose hydrolase
MSDTPRQSPGVLLLRADANPRIGVGHVMRSLALAQEWRSAGGQVVFASTGVPASLAELIASEGFHRETLTAPTGSSADMQATVDLARDAGASWVVVDGHQFPADFGGALRVRGHRVMRVDDGGGEGEIAADVILNQNLNAADDLYLDQLGRSRLLLGARYAMIRHDIRRQLPTPPAPRALRVLISLGGSDALNLTERVFRAVHDHRPGELSIVVLVGAANDRSDAIRRAASGMRGDVQVRHGDARMGAWLAWADAVIAAAGSTAWEIAYMRLPSLLLVTSDNQQQVAHELGRMRAALTITALPLAADHFNERLAELLCNDRLRNELSSRSRGVVDGFGAHRVVAAMTSARVILRRAEPSDSRLIWEWANDPLVRSASFSGAPIPWNDHQRWFADVVTRPDHLFFVAEDPTGAPAGQERFVIAGSDATVSVSVAADKRDMGLGALLIDTASRQAFALSDVSLIRAFIKLDNVRSLRAFERAGYRPGRSATYGGQAAHELVLSRRQTDA